MGIDTTFLRRCIATLDLALEHLKGAEEDTIIYDLHRAACVKEFELVLEQSGKLLRKRTSRAIGRRTVSSSRICSATPPSMG